MKLSLTIMMLLAGFGAQAAGPGSEFATGRAYYKDGEFKKAAAHLELAVKDNPNDAQSCYWLGMSYQVLGDIAVPFGGKYNSRARLYLTRAMDLAPGRPEYRRELFEFLLDSSRSSRATRRQAAGIVRGISESDPDYTDMRCRLQNESKENRSAELRLGGLILAGPQAAYRIGELPVSIFRNLSVAPSAIVP